MFDHLLVAQQLESDLRDLTKFIAQARDIVETRRREPADTKRLERLHRLVDETLAALNYNVQRYRADVAGMSDAASPKSAV